MAAAFLVFLGGGIGSLMRYGAGLLALRVAGDAWPYGTLAVNIVGSLLIGLCFHFLPAVTAGGASSRLLLMTGVLGGFTTFSAFSLDAALLVVRDEISAAFAYVVASVVLSLAAVALGLKLGKAVLG